MATWRVFIRDVGVYLEFSPLSVFPPQVDQQFFRSLSSAETLHDS